jgi:thiamine pyrophosphate-dependent acetolactate synthase large subunit-like protein
MSDDQPKSVLDKMLSDVEYEPEDEAEYQRRAAKERRKSPSERRKYKRDASRTKAGWDLPPDIIEAIQDLSSDNDISQSQIVGYILADWLNRHAEGKASLPPKGDWEPTRGRYLWKIEIPELKR